MWSPPTTPITAPAVPTLAAWHRTWTRDGVRFVGMDGAVTVAHACALPSPLLADVLGRDGARRGVTLEGEHVVRFARDGRATAWILGDRHMAVVEAETDAASCTELVDTLARTFPLRLGAQRARRFEVTPPAGWAPTACDLTVRLDAPDGATFLSIPAATPLGDGDLVEKFLYEEMLIGLVPERIESWPVALSCGLDGELVRAVARHRDAAAPVTFWTAILHDDRYRYTVRLEAPARTALLDATFAQVVETIRPIPRSTPRSVPALFVID